VTAPPRIPDVRIDALLGEGATGTVYAGVNARGEQLAIKVLHEAFADDVKMVARFEREARNAASLRSEFIAQVVGAGRSGGSCWIAYRRLHGETLAVRLGREGVLGAAAMATLIEQVLLGLGVAHQAGVVHRDITPANIMIERTGGGRGRGGGERACILDFGLSKSPTGGAGESFPHDLTSANARLGTVNYMPPEQVRTSAQVDHRADLYSVAVVAYRALSGQLPHVGVSRAAVLSAKLHKEARSLAAATGVAWPRPLEAFFEQSLARDPEARFASAKAMGTAWRHVAESPGVPDAEALRKVSHLSEEGDVTEREGPAGGR
jgi:serine/threonine-protein kinase